MGNIPVVAGPQVQPLGPQSQARASLNSPEAQGLQEVGRGVSALGQGITREAQVIQAAEMRKSSRNDTIDRVMGLNGYKLKVHTEMVRVRAEENLADPAVVKKYHQTLRDYAGEAISAHGGSEASVAEFTARIDDVRGKWTRSSYAEGTKEQFRVLGEHKNSRLGELADGVGDSPDPMTLATSLDSWYEEVDMMKEALTPQQEDDWRREGEAAFIQAAVSANLDNGDPDTAATILNAEGAAESMATETMIRLRSQVARASSVKANGIKQGEDAVNRAKTILGRDLTTTERERIAGVAPTSSPKTLSAKVAEFEKVIGGSATTEQISKMAGAHVATDDLTFGKGLRGRSIQHMIDLSPMVANGMASEEDQMIFMSAVAEYSTLKDPDTGLVQPGKVPLPDYAKQAMDQAGLTLPQGGPGAILEPPNSNQPGAALSTAPGDGQSIWDMAGLVTGPGPAAAEFASGLPVIGGAVSKGFDLGKYTQARNFVPFVQRELVRVLQNNPRYAEGERKAIEQDISIDPRFMDNPTAYRDRLTAIDAALSVRQESAYRTATNPSVGGEERTHALNVLNGLVGFRSQLSVPPLVSTEAEYKNIPDGAKYRWGNEVLTKGNTDGGEQ